MPLTKVSTLIIEVVFFLLTAISFKAKFNGEIFSFFGLVEIESKLLSEIK